MCLEKTARYLLGKITNRDAKNVWKLIQRPGRVFAQLRVAAVAALGGGGELGSAATAPRPLVASSSPAAGA